MSNLPSLLFHPHPKPAEGPRGYLLRLAAENHLLPYDISQQSIFYETENLVRHGLMPDPQLAALDGRPGFAKPSIDDGKEGGDCSHRSGL